MKKILLMLSLTFVGCLIISRSPATQERSGLTIQAVVRLKTARVYLYTSELERDLTWINRALQLHSGYTKALHVRGKL